MFNFEMTFDIGNYVLSGLIPHALGEDLRIQLEELVNHMLISKDRSIRLTLPQAEHPTLIGAANLVFEKTLLNELTVWPASAANSTAKGEPLWIMCLVLTAVAPTIA